MPRSHSPESESTEVQKMDKEKPSGTSALTVGLLTQYLNSDRVDSNLDAYHQEFMYQLRDLVAPYTTKIDKKQFLINLAAIIDNLAVLQFRNDMADDELYDLATSQKDTDDHKLARKLLSAFDEEETAQRAGSKKIAQFLNKFAELIFLETMLPITPPSLRQSP